MWYQVSGTDERTGAPRKVVVEADTEREAVVLAKAEGVKCKTVEYEVTCTQCGEHTGWGARTDAYMICSACRNTEQKSGAIPTMNSATEQRTEGGKQERKARLTVGPRRWMYKMVQVPPIMAVVGQEDKANGAAAKYLQNLVEGYAELGWEYLRLESVLVQLNPGCLGALFGARTSLASYSVAVFRVAVSDDEDSEDE